MNTAKRMLCILLIAVMLAAFLPVTPVIAAAGAVYATYEQYYVSLTGESATVPNEFGTAGAAGLVWADKSVSVTEGFAGFDVTLQALAQEYLGGTSGAGSGSATLAADVTFILDMSTSMNAADVDSYTRVEAMAKATNDAIKIVMAANPKNRVAVHWFGNLMNAEHVGTLMEMDSYKSAANGNYIEYYKSGSTHYVRTVSGVKTGTGATYSQKSKELVGGTPTQDGIFYGVSKAIAAIPTTKDSLRQPFVLILSDGAAIQGKSAFNALPSNQTLPASYTKTGTGNTGYLPGADTSKYADTATGSADIAAVTILTGAYMKNKLQSAYDTYNGTKIDAKFYTIGLGSNAAINGTASAVYAWSGLEPATVYANRDNKTFRNGTAFNTHEKIKTYGPTYINGYAYSDYYKWASSYAALDDAFTKLSSDVEAVTAVLPLVKMPAYQNSVIAMTDTIATGMKLDLATLRIGDSVAKDIGGSTYEFVGYKSKAVISGDTLTWYIAEEDMQQHIFRFKNRANPVAGQYNAPKDGALKLDYRVVPVFTSKPDDSPLTTSYDQSNGAAAYYHPTDENPYYTTGLRSDTLTSNGTLKLELGIVKSGPASAFVGGTLTYGVTVYNYTNAAKSVTVFSESESMAFSVSAGGNTTQYYSATAPYVVGIHDSGPAIITSHGSLNSNPVTTVLSVETFGVTFDASGGMPAPQALADIPKGEKILAPDAPTKAGNVFGGWYKEPGLTTKWDFNKDTVTGSTILYAKWIDKFAVTVNLRLDGKAYTGQSVRLGAAGNTFTDAGSGKHTDEQVANGTYDIYVGGVDTGHDLTVYGAAASTTIDYYTVSFDTDGGSVNPVDQIILSGATPTVPGTPTRNADTFQGWLPDIATSVNARTTYTALWEAAPTAGTATVTVNKDGTEWADNPPEITIGNDPGTAVANGSTLDFGIYGIYADGVDTGKTITVSGVNNYAQINYYTVSFDPNGGTGSTPQQIVLEGGKPTNPTVLPTRSSHTLKGWATSAVGVYLGNGAKTWEYKNSEVTDMVVTGTLTLYAAWEADGEIEGTVTIFYSYDDGGEKKYINTADRVTETTITLIRYNDVTDHWDVLGTPQALSFNPKSVESDTRAFSFGDQPISDEGGVPYIYSGIIDIENYAGDNDGYNNITLTYDPALIAVPFEVTQQVAAPVVPDTVYIKVRYSALGSHGSEAIISQHTDTSIEAAGDPYRGDEDVWKYDWQGNLYDYHINIIGFDVGGLYIPADVSGFTVTYEQDWVHYEESVPGNVSGTMKAKLTPKTYGISYVHNGGSGTASDTYTYGIGKPSMTTSTRTDYHFDGWYSDPEFSGDTCFDEIAVTHTGNMTLYAKWMPVIPDTYTVSGTVTVEGGAPMQNARVSIVRSGTDVFGSDYTDSFGGFTLYNIPSGVYNLVVVYTDVNKIETTVTEICHVSGDTIADITIPNGFKNSIFVHDTKNPAAAVAGLHDVFSHVGANTDDTLGITVGDMLIFEAGGTIEIRLTASVPDAFAQANEISAVGALVRRDNKVVGPELDLSAYKDVIEYSGIAHMDQRLTQINSLVTIYIPLDTAHQGKSGYAVYRYHNGVAESIPREPQSNGNGEFFDITGGGTMLELTVKKFSYYAIAYNPPAPGGGVIIGGVNDSSKVGDGKDSTGDNDLLALSDVSGWLVTEKHDAYMSGRPGSLFAPNDNITRAETAQMLYNLLRVKDVDITVSFPDVPAEAWYATAVNTLASLGIINGFPDGLFHPDASLTRAQLAALVVRFAEVSTGDVQFTDVPETHWAYQYISTAANFGWVNGVGDGRFEPDRNITRAETVKLMNNVLRRYPDKGYLGNHAELNRFDDLHTEHWAYYDILEASITHDFEERDNEEHWKE